MICADCPRIPNGTVKRQICCEIGLLHAPAIPAIVPAAPRPILKPRYGGRKAANERGGR